MEKELKDKIDLGNKRMCLVTCVFATILYIPVLILFIINPTLFQSFLPWLMLLYLSIVCVAIFYSGKIVNKIWKT